MKLIKTEEELQKVISGEKVLVRFSAPWCAPCKVLKKTLDDLESEALINVAEVNIDEAQDLAMKYNVRSVPTTFLFLNSDQLSVFVGVKTREEILEIYNS